MRMRPDGMLHRSCNIRVHMKPISIRLSLGILLLLFAGCGFHLRSYDVDAAFENYFIAASDTSSFASDLRRMLRGAGVAEAASRSEADVVVEVLEERDLQRAVSTTGNARVAEYELEVGVNVRITDGAGIELAPAQWINRTRVFRVDRNNLTSNSEEQSLIQRELRAEVGQALLRTVNAVARNQGASAALPPAPSSPPAAPAPTPDAG
jgi:LPS-assembly lipoprotein